MVVGSGVSLSLSLSLSVCVCGTIGIFKSPTHVYPLSLSLSFSAGVTVGFVVIPQGMAYAVLAELEPQYGLYTSFVGFLLYWAFATSKDITIGTVAVMSQLVGNIVIRVQAEHPEFAAADIARSLSIIAGAILAFIGFIRIGWLVEFIPLVAISSFMTGAAINIAAGQVPKLMGISGVDTRGASYKTIIQTLKALPKTKIDAAVGLSALVGLYAIRYLCNYMSKRQPQRQKVWFFISTLRMTFIILLYIFVSWLVNRHVTDSQNARFAILGNVVSRCRCRCPRWLFSDAFCDNRLQTHTNVTLLFSPRDFSTRACPRSTPS